MKWSLSVSDSGCEFPLFIFQLKTESQLPTSYSLSASFFHIQNKTTKFSKLSVNTGSSLFFTLHLLRQSHFLLIFFFCYYLCNFTLFLSNKCKRYFLAEYIKFPIAKASHFAFYFHFLCLQAHSFSHSQNSQFQHFSDILKKKTV